VIHPDHDGHLTFTRKPPGDGYHISTNFNLQNLKTGDYSCKRYETAETMLREGITPTPDYMASILDATHMEGTYNTRYSTVYDLPGRVIYLYLVHRFDSPLVMDVSMVLEGGDRQVKIEKLFTGLGTPETPAVGLLAGQATAPLVISALGVAAFLANRSRKTGNV